MTKSLLFKFISGLILNCGIASMAIAQSGPMGIAFVQAPEQSSGVAVGDNMGVAISHAIAECVRGGALAADCIITDWCMPAGWSVDFFIQHVEGMHWHEVQCGLSDEASARALEGVLCDADLRPWVADCALVQLYDPEGQPQM